MTWELKNSRVTGLVHCTAYLSRKSVRRFLYTIFCSPPCRWYCTDSSLTLAPFFHYAICFVQRHEEESVCSATIGYQRRFGYCWFVHHTGRACFVEVVSLSMFHVISLLTLLPQYHRFLSVLSFWISVSVHACSVCSRIRSFSKQPPPLFSLN
jgi:hypothetical protein